MKNLKISISEQELKFFEDDKFVKMYSVSTSKFGTSYEGGSSQTPLGNFIVFEKIGRRVPIFTIFKGRKPVNIWNGDGSNSDLILTRILWLSGIDSQNINTKDRLIYIHGTNHEKLIGNPVSHGCIRMKNKDIVELFDLVDIDTKVEIRDNFP